jgi:hypothetical protein
MSKRNNLDGKSEDYKKGYHCGYETAMRKQERKHRKKTQDSNLVDVSKLRIVERGTWLHIEGDNETYICPFCENTTYCEGDYIPKFCMECGNQLKEAENEYLY